MEKKFQLRAIQTQDREEKKACKDNFKAEEEALLQDLEARGNWFESKRSKLKPKIIEKIDEHVESNYLSLKGRE